MPKSSIYNHVSPGVYSREIIDLSVDDELDNGVANLGVVGETENGKAFEPTRVVSWEDFVTKFGNTNPEIFTKSKYPRYELPYIGKTYLTQSSNLSTTRVLGMSGYNAGPAWVLTAHRVLEKDGDEEKRYDEMAVAIIRSRAYYVDYEPYPTSALTDNDYKCCYLASYDKINFLVGELTHKPECTYVTHYNPNALNIGAYHNTYNYGDDCETYIGPVNEEDLTVTYTNHGRFSINGFIGKGEYGKGSVGEGNSNFSYSVTLNPADSNYILKVLGTDPHNGSTPIYVESLFDNALDYEIQQGRITHINSAFTFYDVCYSADLVSVPPVDGLVEKEDGALRRSDYGKRFLYSKNAMSADGVFYHFIANGSKYVIIKKYGACSKKEEDEETGQEVCVERYRGDKMQDGEIYTVLSYTENGKDKFVYGKIHRKTDEPLEYDENLEEYKAKCYEPEYYDNLIQLNENAWLNDEINKVDLILVPDIDSRGNIFNNTVAVKNKKDGRYYVLSPNHYELREKTGMVLDDILYAGTLKTPLTRNGYVRYPIKVVHFYGKDGTLKRTTPIYDLTQSPEATRYLVNVTIYSGSTRLSPPTYNGSTGNYDGYLVTSEFINRLPWDNPNDAEVISATSTPQYPVYAANEVLEGRKAPSEKWNCTGTTYTTGACSYASSEGEVRVSASGASSNEIGIVDSSKLVSAHKYTNLTVVMNLQTIDAPSRNKNYATASPTTTNIDFLPYYFDFGGIERGGLRNLKKNRTAYYTEMSFYSKESGTMKVNCDLNNYKEPYRCAMTPWFVSNVMGDSQNLNVKKLFRFHTVKDGADTTTLVKVSIADISLDEGTFTVYVRDMNDTDANPIIYESYTKCNLSPNTPDYLAYRIGSSDGMYPRKSTYITVEMMEGLDVSNSVPCGFIGYPTIHFEGVPMVFDSRIHPYKEYDVVDEDREYINGMITYPQLMYNTIYDTTLSNRKQYFGLSDLAGIDVDMFTYKGVCAYDDEQFDLTNGFHLDCRLNKNSYSGDDFINISVTVDGEKGYTFDTVDITNQSIVYYEIPIIDMENNMQNNIYSNKNLRKFTAYFYGGFDGWDEHRNYRTTLNRFKTENYRGYFNKFVGEGFSFSKVWDYKSLDLPSDAITSDWYAFLRGARRYSNRDSININLFATPGIDCINSSKLCDTIIDMIEDERGDSLYIMTLPDKPFGAGDRLNDMYLPTFIVDYLDDTNISSSYACVYYPWVKYNDVEHEQYIYLPPTKDVVRNMTILDNASYPWFAPAGKNNGKVECEEPKYKTKLEDEDVLYDGRINAVKYFSFDGTYIWGQKTLQYDDNQLNRIGTRRLLNHIKKELQRQCQGLIFEPNDDSVAVELEGRITNIMGNVQANRGVNGYTFKFGQKTENELPCQIWLQPISALEYIPIDLILTKNGIEFK